MFRAVVGEGGIKSLRESNVELLNGCTSENHRSNFYNTKPILSFALADGELQLINNIINKTITNQEEENTLCTN